MNKNIVVIGSGNVDKIYYIKGDFPEVITSEFLNRVIKSIMDLGGKGANLSVSAAKQAGENNVYFIGCVGKDEAGVDVVGKLGHMNINYSGVQVLDGMQTDGRIILVNSEGQYKMVSKTQKDENGKRVNCIDKLTPDVLETEKINEIIRNADIVAIQMKMPEETIKYVIDYCSENNKPIIVDPTPCNKSPQLVVNNLDLLKKATYLTPNEEEAYALSQYIKNMEQLDKELDEAKDPEKADEIFKRFTEEAKKSFDRASEEERIEVIKELVQAYPNIIATMGEKGVIYNKDGKVIEKPTYPTKCIDSVGAGDTFNGAFVAALTRGESLDEAIEFGLMASSMKVKFEGAQNGMPTYRETKSALDRAKDIMI